MRSRKFIGKRVVFGIAVAAMMLAACAPVPVYNGPTDANVATLRYTNAIGVYSVYSLVTFKDAQNCADPQLVSSNNAQNTAPRAPMTTTVRAGQLTSLKFTVHEAMSVCESAVSFYPRPGRVYATRAMLQGGRCGMIIDDVTDAAHPFPEPTFVSRRRNISDGKCAPLPDGGRALAAIAAQAPTRQNPGTLKAQQANTLSDFQDLLEKREGK